MTKNAKIFLLIGVIIVLPILGFGLTYGLSIVAPLSGIDFYTSFFMLLLVAMGIGIPYWMLKLMSRASHMIDPGEKELKMKDIPKDKEQIDHPA